MVNLDSASTGWYTLEVSQFDRQMIVLLRAYPLLIERGLERVVRLSGAIHRHEFRLDSTLAELLQRVG